MNPPSTRSEQVYISRQVWRGFETVAALHGASTPDDAAPLVCIDALIDEVLKRYLDTIPELAEKRKAIRAALREVEALFTRKGAA